MNLLSPTRGDNNYRYYHHSQIATLNLIRTCQALGMKLCDIKDLIAARTPTSMHDLFAQKINSIDHEIEDWHRARKLLCTLKATIHSSLHVDESAVTVQYLPKQHITLGEQNDYSGDRDDYDALADFYQHHSTNYPEMDLNYSVWGMFSEERIKNRDWRWPCRYYLNDPDGLDEKPAGYYVIGYKRGGYGQSADLYEKMLDYIDRSRFEICGPTFEEYPHNEICVADNSQYLMRVMITVRKL
jgi:DNA-binding transcriptional MerR regulator